VLVRKGLPELDRLLHVVLDPVGRRLSRPAHDHVRLVTLPEHLHVLGVPGVIQRLHQLHVLLFGAHLLLQSSFPFRHRLVSRRGASGSNRDRAEFPRSLPGSSVRHVPVRPLRARCVRADRSKDHGNLFLYRFEPHFAPSCFVGGPRPRAIRDPGDIREHGTTTGRARAPAGSPRTVRRVRRRFGWAFLHPLRSFGKEEETSRLPPSSSSWGVSRCGTHRPPLCGTSPRACRTC
jgi:hypothetical protein